MRLHKVEIQNFRLLTKVELLLEARSTVIVGRNNSGKTSLTELFRRLLGDSTPSFRLEDFSLSVHEGFWKAFQAKEQKKSDDEIRALFPTIEVKLTVDCPEPSAASGADASGCALAAAPGGSLWLPALVLAAGTLRRRRRSAR